MRRDLGGRTVEDEGFEVMGENARAVRLLLALETQWDSIGLSTMASARVVRTKLNYAVIEPTARMAGLGEVTPDDFHRLKFLEGVALTAWAEEAKRQ